MLCPETLIFTGFWRHVHNMHGLPGDLTVRIDHGMGEEMLVVAFREVEALQGTSGFMACIGGLQYGFAQLDEIS